MVYVSGAFPADPQRGHDPGNAARYRERKKVRLNYLRTYDGAVTKRVVEPHGLLCRLNSWYLASLRAAQARRVFLLLNIKELEVIENSSYRMPPGFSLKESYRDVWGTWTENESGELERCTLESAP